MNTLVKIENTIWKKSLYAKL